MNEVWVVWPGAIPKKSIPLIDAWHDQGYKVAVLVNPPHTHNDLSTADRVIVQKEWKGFATAVNILCHNVPGDIVVVAGDDMYPDQDKTAQEIATEFQDRFPDLFGVMQPIGDKYGSIESCAVSPWIGRAFITKVYGGNGPYWEEYVHYYTDEELQAVATQLGVFQQRPDLSHYHDHWSRRKDKRPEYLMKALYAHANDGALFRKRKRAGFPTL